MTAPHTDRRQTLLATALLFALFASYGILRPLRDDVGQYFGRAILPRVWLGTAIVTAVATALLAAAVARWPRRRVAPWAFAAFAAGTALTWLGHRAVSPAENVGGPPPAFWAPAAFYWWVSTYLMVGLALFWGLMADLHGAAAGKRLFGPIAVGGTLGQLGGAGFTMLFAEPLGQPALLGISVALLAVAAIACLALLARAPRADEPGHARAHGVGGSWWQGFAASVRSPYLGGILGYVALQTFASAMLSLELIDTVRSFFGNDRAARTAFNATLDTCAQVLALGLQFAVVGPLMSRYGTGVALMAQPLAYVIGFTILPLAAAGGFVHPFIGGPPLLLAAFVCFEVGRRAANYGLAKPGRDALFTVCTPADKYKAKSAIDAAGFRVFDYVFGEASNAWRKLMAGLIGSGIAASAVVAVPVALAWAGLALGLGRMHRRRGG